MNLRSLVIAAGLLACLAIASLLLAPNDSANSTSGELFMPELAARLNDVRQLSITEAGGNTTVVILGGDAGWRVSEADGYPADVSKLRSNLSALAQAEVQEQKTARPELYSRLGVADIGSPDASGVLLRIDNELAVIVGDTDVAGGKSAYVRRPEEQSSYQICAELSLGSEPRDWLNRRIVDIPASDIRSVAITHPDGETLRLFKPSAESAEFEVAGIPEGRELTYAGVGNSIGAALSRLDLDSVASASDGTAPDTAVVTRFETFAGLTVVARSWRTGEDLLFTFTATAPDGAETDLQDQADAINATAKGWQYAIPDFKADQFVKRISDLLAAT